MENTETAQTGENEKTLVDICRRIGASLDFQEKADGLRVVMSGDSQTGLDKYEISSLPKSTREDACLSVVRLLLFPETAKAVGVPPASSVDELVLKLAVEGA